MEKKTETKIAMGIVTLGVIGTIYTISQKKNTLILKEDKWLDGVKVISFLTLGLGAGLAIGNAETIVQLLKKV